MAVNFLLYRKPSNHAALREWQKHKSELSLKALIMRLCDTKKLKKVHFPIFEVAETKQSCGFDDDWNDNLIFIGFLLSDNWCLIKIKIIDKSYAIQTILNQRIRIMFGFTNS